MLPNGKVQHFEAINHFKRGDTRINNKIYPFKKNGNSSINVMKSNKKRNGNDYQEWSSEDEQYRSEEDISEEFSDEEYSSEEDTRYEYDDDYDSSKFEPFEHHSSDSSHHTTYSYQVVDHYHHDHHGDDHGQGDGACGNHVRGVHHQHVMTVSQAIIINCGKGGCIGEVRASSCQTHFRFQRYFCINSTIQINLN